jgi:uncharacterized protein
LIRRFRTSVLLVSLLLFSAAILFAAETPIPPTPTRWVTDTAGFMSPQAASALDRRLEAYEQQTGHQVLVYIGQTTGGPVIEDWADRAFQKWKVGRKGIDDGLVLFIMAQDRRLRFEVGYGLEGQVPDSLAGRVINEIMVPRIQAGDQDGAVTSGIDAITQVIGGQGLPAPVRGPNGRQARPLTLGQLIIYGIIGIVLLIVLATNPSLAIWLLMSIMSGGNRRSRGGWGGGGGGFGGGGFSGGGGRSGGGGASGSW